MVEEGWLWSLCEGIESCSSLVVVVIIEDEDGNGGCQEKKWLRHCLFMFLVFLIFCSFVFFGCFGVVIWM
jgi:nitrate reductase NapE component